jgi:5-hydroxyisourate hydrolase
MTKLTTHVLDVATGKPAAGIAVTLVALANDERRVVASTVTNADGRTDAPLASDLASGTYEIVFGVGAYYATTKTDTLYADVPIRVVLDADRPHDHVPLLLSPFGYSTYRGS